MLVSEITIYDVLKGIFGEEKARQAVAGIKEEVAQEVEIQKTGLATKENIFALKEDIYSLKAELKTDISETKAEMIKWMFTFVSGALVINILAMLGAVFMLANLLKK